jgi:hypothetical protein
LYKASLFPFFLIFRKEVAMVATPLKSAEIIVFLLPCGVATGGKFAAEAGLVGPFSRPIALLPPWPS